MKPAKQAQVFEVENQLAKVVREPGGRTVEKAVKAAEERIESVRDVSVASLVQKAEQVAQAASAARASGNAADFGPVYDVSNAIYGIATSFALNDLAEAAFSLCDLADNYRGGEAPNWPAIDVHVDGVRLLAALREKAGQAGAKSILEGLKRVRARVLPPA
jgi:hypothetical protein